MKGGTYSSPSTAVSFLDSKKLPIFYCVDSFLTGGRRPRPRSFGDFIPQNTRLQRLLKIHKLISSKYSISILRVCFLLLVVVIFIFLVVSFVVLLFLFFFFFFRCFCFIINLSIIIIIIIIYSLIYLLMLR